MDDQSDVLREAVAVFTTEGDLQAAVDELLSSGFHRAELSLLAGEDTLNEKLGRGFANVRDLEDDPAAPRSAYISPEAIGDAQGGIVGALVYAGATAAAGAMFVSGGTILGALVVATVVGGAGSVVGALLPNGWVITTDDTSRRKSIMEAFSCGCEPRTPRRKNAH